MRIMSRFLKCNKSNFSKIIFVLRDNASLRYTVINGSILLGIILFSCWLMHHTFRYKDGMMFPKGKVWSDFGGHIALIRSFSMGDNFPPEHPTFSGPSLTYHFLFDFLVGMLEKLGVNIAFAFNFLSAIGLSLLLWLIYRLSYMLFSSVTAGILAILLFLFNGSLSFIPFFQNHPLHIGSWKDIISATTFASFGPWDGIVAAFWSLNIYTNQRHLGLGFALIFLFLWPLFRYTFYQKNINISCKCALLFLGALTPLIQKAAIPITMIYCSAWMLFHPKSIKPFRIFYVLLLILSIPANYYLTLGSVHQITFEWGFLAPQKDFLGWLTYWWYNMGLYGLLIPILFVWGNKHLKALILAGLILFGISNTFRLSTDMFNNHKLINFFMISLQIATSGFLVAFWKKRINFKPLVRCYLNFCSFVRGIGMYPVLKHPRFAAELRAEYIPIPLTNLSRRALVCLLLIGLTFSGLVDIFPIINDPDYHVKDIPKSEIMRWIARHTEPKSIFLVSDGFYNPATLVGRKLFLGYTYNPWSAGYPAYEREKIVNRLFAEDITQSDLCQELSVQKIDYVMIAWGKGSWSEVDVQKSCIAKNWHPECTFSNETRIYDVQNQCYNNVRN